MCDNWFQQPAMDRLNDPEYDLSLVKEQLNKISMQQGSKDIEQQIEAVKAKYERMTQLIKEHKRTEKKKLFVAKEIETVRAVIAKAQSSLAKCTETIEAMEEKESNKAKILEKAKDESAETASVWNLLGLKCTKLDSLATDNAPDTNGNDENGANNNNGVPMIAVEGGDAQKLSKKLSVEGSYEFEFSKIDTLDQSISFIIKVQISKKFLTEKNGSCFKIYESDPSDLLTSPEIDTIETNAGSDSRKLIVLLRKHIESKASVMAKIVTKKSAEPKNVSQPNGEPKVTKIPAKKSSKIPQAR